MEQKPSLETRFTIVAMWVIGSGVAIAVVIAVVMACTRGIHFYNGQI